MFHARLPQQLLASLAARPATVALTGAGISAESGIPTFRDAQTGLWARYRPQQLASPEAFERDPCLVWRWYQWRRRIIAAVEPNAGHRALAEMEKALDSFCVITQNVDGLHRRAGSRNVIHLHGDLWGNRCQRCAALSAHEDNTTMRPPHCARCGGLMRPAVVWFGEPLPASALSAAAERIACAELVLVIGTSGQVYPAAALAEQAIAQGSMVAELNPARTPLSAKVRWRLELRAAEALPRLAAPLRRPSAR